MLAEFSKPATYGQYAKNLLPSVLTMVFLSFYTTIDGFFVSRYAGSDPLAAINIVVPVTCIVFGIAVMLATGAGAIIGMKMGEGKMHLASRIFTFISLALVGISLIITATGLIFLEESMLFLGASERLMPHAVVYGAIVYISTLPMSFKLFFEYLARTDGSPKVALYMSMSGLIFNIVFDYLFIAVYGMGIMGAGLGTLLSITISMLIGLWYFMRSSRLKFVAPLVDWGLFMRASTNGSSEMLTEWSTGITTFLFNLTVFKYYGEEGVSAITIIMFIYYFFIAFYMGIAVAIAPIVSYSKGAKNYEKISETLRYSWLTIGISSVVIYAISFVHGRDIIGIFTDNALVFDITWEGLKIFSSVFLFIGVNVFLSGYFTALGYGITSAVISILRSLVFVVAFIIVLPVVMGERGIWATMPASELITIFVSVPLFFKLGLYWKSQASAGNRAKVLSYEQK